MPTTGDLDAWRVYSDALTTAGCSQGAALARMIPVMARWPGPPPHGETCQISVTGEDAAHDWHHVLFSAFKMCLPVALAGVLMDVTEAPRLERPWCDTTEWAVFASLRRHQPNARFYPGLPN